MASFKVLAHSTDENRHSDDVEFIAEYPFNGLYYSGGDDGKLKIWNRDLTLRHDQKLHEYRVHHAAFTADSIFTCSNSPFIKEWTHLGPDGLVQKRQLEGHIESVRKLRVSHGSRLVSGGDDGRVNLWYINSGKIDAQFNVLEEVWDLKVDGKYLITARDRGVTIQQLCDEDQRFMVAGAVPGRAPLALTPDILYCVEQMNSLQILGYNRRDYKPVVTINASDRIIRALACSNDVIFSGGYDQTIKAFDRKTGTELATLSLGSDITAITVTGSGTVLVGLAGGGVRLLEFTRTKAAGPAAPKAEPAAPAPAEAAPKVEPAPPAPAEAAPAPAEAVPAADPAPKA